MSFCRAGLRGQATRESYVCSFKATAERRGATAAAAQNLQGEVRSSGFATDLGRRLWWCYLVLGHQKLRGSLILNPLLWVIIIATLLLTALITTHENLSSPFEHPHKSTLWGLVLRSRTRQTKNAKRERSSTAIVTWHFPETPTSLN